MQEAVSALTTPDHRRRAPLSPAPCRSGGEPPLLSCCNPAQEGEGTSLWVGWLKYQGYATADDGHKRGSLHQIQNKSRTPCKQHRGSSQNVPFPARAPTGIMELQSRGDLCLHFPYNLHTAAIANLHTTEEMTTFSLFLWIYSWFSSSFLLAPINSRNCNFILVYWITDNKEFRRRSREPYRGEFSCSKRCYLNAH